MADDLDTTDPVAALPAALAYTLGGDQGVKNPALAEKYLTERRGRSAKYAADYEDVMSQRQAEVENAKRILDGAAEAMRAGHTGAGPGQINLPLLQMAAGFFKPTKTGNFGEEFGNALTGLGAGVAHQRMSNVEFEKGMADLATKRSTLVQEPLKDRAALLKAQQLADEQGVRALEVAQVKTAGGSGLSPIAKIEADFNAGRISRTQADEAIKKLTQGSSGPAELQMYNAALQYHLENGGRKEDFPGPDEWKARRAGAVAQATATGKDIAEAKDLLPKLEADALRYRDEINNLLSDKNKPYLKQLVGQWNGLRPDVLQTDENIQNVIGSLETLGSMNFGTAVATMKGLGALSNAEGAKIQDAVGKLKRRGSYDEFERRLIEMRDRTSIVAVEIAKKKLEWADNPNPGVTIPSRARPPSPSPTAPAPTAGGLVKGDDGVYRFTTGGQ